MNKSLKVYILEHQCALELSIDSTLTLETEGESPVRGDVMCVLFDTIWKHAQSTEGSGP